MHSVLSRRVLLLGLALLLVQSALPVLAFAHHDLGKKFHWQREENPFTLKVGDNVSPLWNQALDRATKDWSRSSVLDMNVVPGSLNPKACEDKETALTGTGRPGRGEAQRLEVCNGDFGGTPFLGITSFLRKDGHIRRAIVALNDFYFDNPDFPRGVNNPHIRLSVMCHELGHAIGLDHPDGRDSCMTNSRRFPDHPDSHDYQELRQIYDHEDDRTTVDGARTASADEPALVLEIPTGREARQPIVVKDLGGGWQQVTIVDWFDPNVLKIADPGQTAGGAAGGAA